MECKHRLRDAERRALDEESKAAKFQMRQIQERMLSNKSKRNELAPIHLLPLEVLSLIFVHYIHDPDLKVRPKYFVLYDTRDMLANIQWTDIMRVMSVCRTWRSIALDTPNFWSQIIFSPRHPWMTEEMLARSKGTPLYIRISEEASPSGSYAPDSPLPLELLLIIKNIGRVREMHLGFSKFPAILNALGCQGQRAEMLRSISLFAANVNRSFPLEGINNIFTIYMPNLQHLHLHLYSAIQWEGLRAASRSSFSKLISLHLTATGLSSTAPSRMQFYGTLSAAKNLEDLHLDHVFPISDHVYSGIDSMEEDERLSFPRLSSCALYAISLSQCMNFHLRISYPTTTARLAFNTYQAREEVLVDGYSGLMANLLSLWGISEENPRRSYSSLILITGTRADAFSAAFWDGASSERPRASFDWKDNTRVILDFTHSHLHSKLLLEHLSSPTVTRIGLVLAADAIWDSQWPSFFQKHPNVTELLLRTPFSPQLVSTLCTPTGQCRCQERNRGADETSLSRRCFYLPKLTRLVLEETDLPGVDDLAMTRVTERNDEILSCLTQRLEHGLRLRELHLHCVTGWTEESFNKLPEIALKATWSGIMAPYEVEGDEDLDSDYVTSDKGSDAEGDSGVGDHVSTRGGSSSDEGSESDKSTDASDDELEDGGSDASDLC